MECGTYENYKEAYQDLISDRITDKYRDHLTGILIKLYKSQITLDLFPLSDRSNYSTFNYCLTRPELILAVQK